MVTYSDLTDGLEASQLRGFYEDWPLVDAEHHLRLLKSAPYVVVARFEQEIVGFGVAVTDGVLSAHIPFLEVRPDFRGQGIGREIARLLLMKIDLPQISVAGGTELREFFVEMGFSAKTMMIRRRDEGRATEADA